jgi:hypothetical protein
MSASPPVRVTESASWAKVCAARAASVCVVTGPVLSLSHAPRSAVATTAR